jgi:hypothetical protein
MQWSTEERRREIELAATRVVEILESFRGVNRRLCDELIECLGTLDPDGIFGDPVREPATAQMPIEPAADQPAPRMTEVDRMLADLKAARYDDKGRRLNPGRRAFSHRAPQVRGSHWSW